MPLMFSLKIYIQYVCFPIMHRLLDFPIVKFGLVDQLLKLTFYFHMYHVYHREEQCAYVYNNYSHNLSCVLYIILIRTLSINE